MSFEEKVQASFIKVKEDTEFLKNELAMNMKRIANLESLMSEIKFRDMSKSQDSNIKAKKKK